MPTRRNLSSSTTKILQKTKISRLLPQATGEAGRWWGGGPQHGYGLLSGWSLPVTDSANLHAPRIRFRSAVFWHKVNVDVVYYTLWFGTRAQLTHIRYWTPIMSKPDQTRLTTRRPLPLASNKCTAAGNIEEWKCNTSDRVIKYT